MNTAYLYVAVTVACTVYGQIIVKWQTGRIGTFPAATDDRLRYFWDLLTNPWMISSLAATAIAAAAWIVALSHLELSRAYPFVSASFVLVLVLSVIVFGESMSLLKISGALLIVAGLILGSQG
jgi:drug/metabolite transporter (DMT)-like permease